jgi:hypothetical protein
MAGIEKINGGGVLSLDQFNLQFSHAPSRRHPEIVSHHHDRLNVLAITLTQSGNQFCVLLTPLRMEPLLELVKDEQELLPRTQYPSFPHCC